MRNGEEMGKCPILGTNPGYQIYTHANAGHISVGVNSGGGALLEDSYSLLGCLGMFSYLYPLFPSLSQADGVAHATPAALAGES